MRSPPDDIAPNRATPQKTYQPSRPCLAAFYKDATDAEHLIEAQRPGKTAPGFADSPARGSSPDDMSAGRRVPRLAGGDTLALRATLPRPRWVRRLALAAGRAGRRLGVQVSRPVQADIILSKHLCTHGDRYITALEHVAMIVRFRAAISTAYTHAQCFSIQKERFVFMDFFELQGLFSH
jgi:hypothetical protein